MPPLYVVKQGAKLRIQKHRLSVEYDNEILSSLPLNHVSQVVLFGNVGLTTPAISRLLSGKIEVVFITQRGSYKGSLHGLMTPHVPLRKSQYALHGQEAFTLAIAKKFVKAKLRHQRTVLRRNWNEGGGGKREAVLKKLDWGISTLMHKENLNSLRGVEGAAGAAYFQGYRSLFHEKWGFDRRNRRPPRDPVNVLLSFGYTLLTNNAISAVRSAGLDVFAGFLHAVDYNRPSMALDLVEEFRPLIDGLVLWCCRSNYLTKDFFKKGDGKRPVILDPEGQKKYIEAFENRMRKRFTHPVRQQRLSIRQCLFEQAHQVADSIRNGQPTYKSMGFR